MITRDNVVVTVGLCFLVAVLEGFDIQAMGVAAPRLAPQFALDAKSNGLGVQHQQHRPGHRRQPRRVVGGHVRSQAGVDGRGRRVRLLHACHGAHRRLPSLLAVRFCAGLGFGAALPNLMAIAAEISRPEKAASTAAAMFCGMPFGGGLAALTTQLLPAGFDWRILFILGGVLPLLLIPALHRWMPETLVRASANRSPNKQVARALFGEGRATPTLLLWLAFLPTLLILYLFLNWLPTLMIAKGFDRAVAPQASLAFNFGSVAGALLIGWLVDRFHFRWPLTLAYLALIVTLILLASSRGMGMAIVLSGAVGFFLLGANYALYGVAPVYYPQPIRGTGSGASIAVGRVGSIAGPLLAGLLMGGGTSATSVVQYMVPVAAISVIAVFALSFRGTSSPRRIPETIS